MLDSTEDILYLTYAAAKMADNKSTEVYLRSHFPEATEFQIQSSCLYALGVFHNGIVAGLNRRQEK